MLMLLFFVCSKIYKLHEKFGLLLTIGEVLSCPEVEFRGVSSKSSVFEKNNQ